jgi:hypothetical protein
MADTNLTVHAEVIGGPQAAEDLSKVAAATTQAASATSAQGTAAGEAAPAFERLTASERDYLGVIRNLNPEMAPFVDLMFKGVKVAGDFTQGNKGLADILGNIAGVLNTNVSSLGAFFGVATAVATGVALAWRTMRAEMEAATDAIKRQSDALTQLRSKQREEQQGIEDIADARREGGFTADEARAAQVSAQTVRKRFPFLDEAEVQKATALSGLTDTEGIAETAFLLQSGQLELEPGMRAQSRARRIAAGRRRHRGVIDRALGREAQQRRPELFAEAADEARSPGGSTSALETVIGELGLEGVDPANIARIIPFIKDVDEQAMIPGLGEAGRANLLEEEAARHGVNVGNVSTQELAESRRILVTINNYNQGQRHTYPSQKAQQEAIDRAGGNGESKARNAEELRLQGR